MITDVYIRVTTQSYRVKVINPHGSSETDCNSNQVAMIVWVEKSVFLLIAISNTTVDAKSNIDCTFYEIKHVVAPLKGKVNMTFLW